jgi:hypothetical protein
MHPADEYAQIAAEIRRLKTRQTTLREALIKNSHERRSNRYEVVVKDVQRRVFLRDKLPAHILQDETYWEVRKLHRLLPRQRVVVHGQVHRLQPLDLVAQAGGFLELQVLGGLAHLRPQPVQMRLQVRADHGLSTFAVTRFMSTSPL